MSEEIAKDQAAKKILSKTRQFYGFVGETNYDEALVAELRHDWEESGMIADPLGEKIAINPETTHGRPVIKGTRVPVEIILGALAGGMEMQEVASEYGLEREDVLAAIGYAARVISSKRYLI